MPQHRSKNKSLHDEKHRGISKERPLLKIVSGGQTGVDRAALDTALEYGIPAGGWCPEGRRAEDGEISENYPVKILPSAGYAQRTEQNVIDSEGTLIIYFATLSGGTEQTLLFCIKHKKRYLLIDADEVSETGAAERLRLFVNQNRIHLLNIAGPRKSGAPGAYRYTKNALGKFMRRKKLGKDLLD